MSQNIFRSYLPPPTFPIPTLHTLTSFPTQLRGHPTHPPTHRVQFKFPNKSWTSQMGVWSSPWSVVDLCVMTKLNETASLSQQLSNAKWSLATGVISCPPSPVHGSILSGLRLLSSSVCWLNCLKFLAPCYAWTMPLLWSAPPPLGLGVFPASFMKIPEPCRAECGVCGPFWAECSIVSYSLHVDQLMVSMWTAFPCK